MYKTFEFALAQHASVLNAKSTDIPSDYVAAIDELLRKNGYRFVVDSLNHVSVVQAGQQTRFSTTWSNLGVAPHYLPRKLSYRLKKGSDQATFDGTADTRTWLPGSWTISDTFTVPATLPPGTYSIEVALLDRPGTNPTTIPLAPLFLGIEGRGSDGWYALSTLEVQ